MHLLVCLLSNKTFITRQFTISWQINRHLAKFSTKSLKIVCLQCFWRITILREISVHVQYVVTIVYRNKQ